MLSNGRLSRNLIRNGPRTVSRAFDPVAGVGGAVQSFTAGTQVPNNLTGLSLDVSNNILAAINFGDVPNDMQLYLLSGNSNAPALFNQAFFSVNNANAAKITATHIFPPAGSARTGQIGLRWSF